MGKCVERWSNKEDRVYPNPLTPPPPGVYSERFFPARGSSFLKGRSGLSYIHLKLMVRIHPPPHLQIRTNTTTPPLKKYINKKSVYITFRLYIQKNFHRINKAVFYGMFLKRPRYPLFKFSLIKLTSRSNDII